MSDTAIRLGGIVPPLLTPLQADGALDLRALERLANWLIDAGAGGLFVLGSSGEGPWLTPDDRAHVIRSVVHVTAGRVPVLAGVLEPGTARVIEAVAQAEELGVDAVVVTTPYYFGADADAQTDHFAAVAGASQLPVILYNIPSMTHALLAPSTVRSLLDVANVVGIKDSAGDAAAFAELIELKALRPGFCVMQGAERQALSALRAGADGVVPGLGNLAPELFVEMAACVAAGSYERAEHLQGEVTALWELHAHGFWLECLKYAAGQLGFGSGVPYDRRARLDESGKIAIRRILERARS